MSGSCKEAHVADSLLTSAEAPMPPALQLNVSSALSSADTQQRPHTARILRPSSISHDEHFQHHATRPQTARERAAPPVVSNARKLFVSRPLSAVPIVNPPMGTSSSVVKKYWPEMNVRKKASEELSRRTATLSDNNQENSARQEVRSVSPVHWPLLEKPAPLAASERRCLTKDGRKSGKFRTKYAILCPSKPHELRPSSSPQQRRQQNSDEPVDGTFLTLKENVSFHRRPKSARVSSVEFYQPKNRWNISDFFTPEEIPRMKIFAKSEPLDLSRTDKPQVLTQQNLDRVIGSLPFACEGRIVLDAQLKKVLIEHEEGLFQRIQAHNKAKQNQITTEIIQNNLDIVHDPEYRRIQSAKIIARAREKMAKVKEAKERKKAHEEEYRQNAAADLDWRMRATERKQQKAEQTRMNELTVFLVTIMTLYKVSRNFRQSLLHEKEARATLAKKKVAVKVIIKHFMKFRMKRSSQREANAMMILAMRLPFLIQRWRARSLARKTNIIISYLRDISNFAKLQLAVKQFRRRIVKAQQLVKNWLACKRARYEMLEMQFNKVDAMRNHEYNMRREAQLRRIKARLDKQLELKGNSLGAFKTKLTSIERIGGPKAVRELKNEVEASRMKFCEKFLSPEMQQLPQISPIVKSKMLQLYVRKVRARYQLEMAAYRMKRAVWAELRESQTTIRHFAENFTEDLSNPDAVSYFKKKIGFVVPDLEPPKRPLPNIVLQPHLMEQIIQKAVEHTQKLADRSLASQLQNGGIHKPSNLLLSPKSRREKGAPVPAMDTDFV